jgi:hypothetical protein
MISKVYQMNYSVYCCYQVTKLMLKSQYLSFIWSTMQTFYTNVKVTLISTFEKCRFLDTNTVRNTHSRRIERNDDNLRGKWQEF